ncbi:MAG: hypothetical protein JL50_04075 [Peptococcaceae bacterium BICA1-7]|nr:MAG: hypothetical protein JL50_04075 [Peptococcaceae bacterium BICA1-7]HBV97559.1 hypothetical protein [Desulfotomaculum sp.]
MKKAMKINIILCLLICFTASGTSPSWADTNPDTSPNPFGTDYSYQGYSLIRFIFPDQEDEYRVTPIYGINPEDGKQGLYLYRPEGGTQYISSKLKFFLDGNDVDFHGTSGQYNIWDIYDLSKYPFIWHAGERGSGSFVMKQPFPNGALYTSREEIISLWNSGKWLINPAVGTPETGPARAPGWITTIKFLPPDMQATSVVSGAPAGGGTVSTTYQASATFYLNYKIPGWSTVRLYQFKADNSALLLTEQPVYFGSFGGVNIKSVPWTMVAGTTKIVASVGMRWNNSTRSWVKDSFSNPPYIDLEGDIADYNWNNNTVVAPVNTGEIPKPPEDMAPSNLAVSSLQLLNSNGQPISGTVEVNKQYQVKAVFKSSFDVGGYAKVRFYVKREAGWMEFRKEENVYFSPKGTVEKTWDWTGLSEQLTLIATVAYRWWDQQGQYVKEPFEGRTESTYNDNRLESPVAGTDIPEGPPVPGSWEYPLYYHPLKKEVIPIYEEHIEPVYGYREVPITLDQSQARLRVFLTE